MTVMNSMSSRLVVCTMMVTTLLAGGCDNSQQDAVIPDQTVADNVTAGNRVTAGQAKEIAKQAFFWGFHPVAFYHKRYRSIQDESSPYYVGKNRFYWSREPLTASDRIATTPNATTLYGFAQFDLAEEPFVVTIPKIEDRYWSVQASDHYPRWSLFVGSQTGEGAQKRLLVGPSWTGPLAPEFEGMEVVVSPSDYVFLLARIGIRNDGRREVAAVNAIMDQIHAVPYSKWKAGELETPVERGVLATIPGMRGDVNPEDIEPLEFYKWVSLVLNDRSFTKRTDSAREVEAFKSFARLGMGGGRIFDPERWSEEIQQALIAGYQEARKESEQHLLGSLINMGNGWMVTTDFGYSQNDWKLRSGYGLRAVAAPIPFESHTAAFIFVDSEGQPLSGEHRYTLTFDMEDLPPVSEFWSLPMYNMAGYFIENPIERYSVNSFQLDDGAYHISDDGQLTFYIQNERPTDPDEAKNWLPTPKGRFRLTPRFYGPRADLIDGTWKAPALVRSRKSSINQTRSASDVPPVIHAGDTPVYSPYANSDFPMEVYWGDTHLHTGLSIDAFGFGNKLGAEEAFRFARGEAVKTATGQLARLRQPLDFLVIADHAEALGVGLEVFRGNPELLSDPQVMSWHRMFNEGREASFKAVMEIISGVSKHTIPKVMLDSKFFQSVWSDQVATADQFNEPGKFTAFIGYEWSSHPGGNNIHRVVVYRDGADKAVQMLPFTSLQSEDPEDLWGALQAYEDKTGGSVFAIPHNGNLSNGHMFAVETMDGKPLTREYAEQRMRWEPLYEVTQIKGDGEAHPLLSPNDEFADYETWARGNLDLSTLKTDDMLQYEYARSGLGLGLEQEEELGANPFKFGLIGSTDSHTSLATASEENFFGKHSGKEPSAERWSHPVIDLNGVRVMGWEMAASGYAAVWAEDNTREALFDAMKRKETYATTGSRMTVRFFGGWNFEEGDTGSRVLSGTGYAKGVPMGGDLSRAPVGRSPTFLVAALKDPAGGNLDRIQIVKGWLDDKGRQQERVYDVAWSGDRKPGPNGKLPDVGNTVDVAGASWTNTIGAQELTAVWTDPAFDPRQRAFYYGRVLEIPTPRWTAYDAKYFGVKMDDNIPMITRERAYTSPIWYSPE